MTSTLECRARAGRGERRSRDGVRGGAGTASASLNATVAVGLRRGALVWDLAVSVLLLAMAAATAGGLAGEARAQVMGGCLSYNYANGAQRAGAARSFSGVRAYAAVFDAEAASKMPRDEATVLP